MYAPNVYTLDVAGMMSGATDLSKYRFRIEAQKKTIESGP